MERSDLELRVINLTTHDGFKHLPEVYRALILEMEAELAHRQHLIDTVTSVATKLLQQSTKAHETLDALGVPVCGLGIGDRMGCVEKQMSAKDRELDTCREVLNRLAHESKARLRDMKDSP